MLDIDITRFGSASMWRLSGDLTATEASHLRTATQRLSTSLPVHLDLSGVRRVDRPGLGALIGLFLKARQVGAPVRIVEVAAPLQRLLRVEGLDRLLRLARPNA